MAVISKTDDFFGKKRVVKIVKFSVKNKQFEIDLPKAAHYVCGEKVSGISLDEANKNFNKASEIYLSSTEKKAKVIVVDFVAEAFIEREGKELFNYAEWGDRDGVSLKLCCEVYDRYTWTLHDGEKVNKYFEAPHQISDSANFEYIPSVGHEDIIEIPWSKEREQFFVQLVEAFEELILKLNNFTKNAKNVLLIVDRGIKLLPAPQEDKGETSQ